MRNLILVFLAGAAITTAGAGQGQTIKVSSFVTDTLFAAVGGSFVVVRSHAAPPRIGGRDVVASTAPSTLVTFYTAPDDHAFAHETGHVADRRGIFPARVIAAAMLGRTRARRDYFHTDDDEYVAEAFARAIESGRRGFRDSSRTEKDFPGSIEFVRWLLTREPFSRPAVN